MKIFNQWLTEAEHFLKKTQIPENWEHAKYKWYLKVSLWNLFFFRVFVSPSQYHKCLTCLSSGCEGWWKFIIFWVLLSALRMLEFVMMIILECFVSGWESRHNRFIWWPAKCKWILDSEKHLTAGCPVALGQCVFLPYVGFCPGGELVVYLAIM